MKAVVYKKPKVLMVEDVPEFKPEKDQVIIAVKACGICGSDLRYYEGENPWALHTLGVNAPSETNMILGHEFSGIVVEAGSKNFESLIGKRIVAIPYNTCGTCELCLTGRYHLCRKTKHLGHGAGWGHMAYYPGGMAELCPVWRTHALEIPESISFEAATLIDPLSVAIHAINLAGVKPMANILVLGSGPVGLCLVQAVRAFGADQVYCTDIVDAPLRIAGDVGVDETMNARTVDICDKVMSLTSGRGVDVVFDTVGSAESQSQGLSLLAVSGILVNLVANESMARYRLLDLSGERRIVCSANSRYEDYLLAIKMLETGIMKADPLITHRFAIDQAGLAFDVLLDREKSGSMKVIIEP